MYRSDFVYVWRGNETTLKTASRVVQSFCVSSKFLPTRLLILATHSHKLVTGVGYAMEAPLAKILQELKEMILPTHEATVYALISWLDGGDRKYGIPPISPFQVDEIKVEEGPKQTGLALTIRKANIYGLENVDIKKTDFDFDKKHAHFEFGLDLATLLGQYEVQGRVLILPINGNGDMNITLVDPEVVFDIDYDMQEKDGDEYLHLKDYKITLTPKRVYFALTNLFNGDQALGKQMNEFLNENWQDVYKELSNPVIQALGEIVYSILNSLTGKVPANVAFPEKL